MDGAKKDKIIIKKEMMIQKNNKKIDQVYKIAKKAIGTGAYGVVSLCQHRETKQERAVKKVPKKKIKNMDRFKQEIKILQQLDHPNVLRLYEYFEDEKNVYLVTEACRGGELFDRIIENEYFSELEAAKIFRQILQSLNYCHHQGIAHRDLKPENFLFETKDSDSELKIIDFGLAKIMNPVVNLVDSGLTGGKGKKQGRELDRMNTRAGTPNYISPEVLAGSYSIDCDLWSAGCILYILLCGYPPFYGDDDNEILQMVARGKFDFDGEEWLDVSKDAKDLIKKLICKPEKRLSAQEALDHKWFKKVFKNEKVAKPITFGKQRLDRFKSYNQNNKMQQATLMSMSVQVSPAEVKELSTLFKQLDTDGSGTLTLDELIKGLHGFENKDKLIEILEGADADGSGDINYSEFIAATLDDQIYMREDYLKTAFDMFDKDSSGKIDSQEVIALLSGEDVTSFVSKDAIDQALKEIDENGDGEIDFQEFMVMMKRAAENDQARG